MEVGDRVRIRKDLEIGEEYGDLLFSDGMAWSRGRKAGLIGIGYRGYIIDIDSRCYDWSEEMLEPLTGLEAMEVGDIIVDEDGDEAKVLEVGETSFLKSYWDDYERTTIWYSFEEAEEKGWKLKGEEDKTGLTELTLKEVAEKFEIPIDKLRIKED